MSQNQDFELPPLTDEDKKIYDSGDPDAAVRRTLERMIEAIQNPQKKPEGPKKDFNEPLNLDAKELEAIFTGDYGKHSGINATVGMLTTPVWALSDLRQEYRYRHTLDFKEEFYYRRGRKYHDQVFEYADSLEEALNDKQSYPAFYRPTCSGVFGAYHPVYEEQWFWPMMSRWSLYHYETMQSPMSIRALVDCLPKNAQLAYSNAYGEYNGEIYTHEYHETMSREEPGRIAWQSPKYNYNKMQESPSFYVGLNTLQRAVCLWAVNEMFIPMLNADDYIPGLWAFLPDLSGRFDSENAFAEMTVFFGEDLDDPRYTQIRANNARVRNKSIILRHILRYNQIPQGYRPEMSNEDMVWVIDEECGPESAWTIAPWDNHIIPEAPAQTFFEQVMTERGTRPFRLFGRGALWRKTGQPRAGLMHGLDLMMLKDALELLIKFDDLFGKQVPKMRDNEPLDKIVREISQWFGGIGMIDRVNYAWPQSRYHKAFLEFHHGEYDRSQQKTPYRNVKKRSGYLTEAEQLAEMDEWLRQRRQKVAQWEQGIFEEEDIEMDELFIEQTTFYDFNNRDIADMVYGELAELYELGPKTFEQNIHEHLNALRRRYQDICQETPEDDRFSNLQALYQQKAQRRIALPFGLSLTQAELMEVVESIYNGISNFLERPKGEITLDEEKFSDSGDPTDLNWYKPVTHSTIEQGSGVYFGYAVIMDLICLQPDDVLNGKSPDEAVPVIEENRHWSYLTNLTSNT